MTTASAPVQLSGPPEEVPNWILHSPTSVTARAARHGDGVTVVESRLALAGAALRGQVLRQNEVRAPVCTREPGLSAGLTSVPARIAA